MSGQGSAPRSTLDLRVRVWGMSAHGQPFFQNCSAQNVSSSGACLHGIETAIKVGDVIGVQYESHKARCKIIWLVDAGGQKKMQVGVQLVADQEAPWLNQLPPESRTPAAQSAAANRRRFGRHRISFPLELRDDRASTPMRVSATDISGNGCYVETIMPLILGTTLRVEFFIDAEHISATAVVRTRDPGVGMGVEFAGMSDDAKVRFQKHLDKLSPGLSGGPKSSQ
jgi:hypothetical protein